MNLLTFDVGGTQLKYGIVDQSGEVLFAASCDTPKSAGGAGLVAALAALAKPLITDFKPQGIAISTLGLVDAFSGMILGAAEAIPGYVGTSPKAELAELLGLPVSIDNDVNCVALAEGWRGSAQGAAHYIAIAIGTGIGGGIVLNHQIYRGHRAAAGEWGYMNIRGVLWEDHASMRGLVNAAQWATGIQGLDGRAVFEAYDQQDPLITPVVKTWFTLLATGIANLIYVFNPQKIVLGGGISGRGELFLREITQAVEHELLPDFRGMTDIVLASAGNHAGMIGAARNWLQSH